MTVSRRCGSLILTVSLLAFLTAGSALVSQATPERPVEKKPAPAVIEKHKEKAKDEPEMPAFREELIAEVLKKGEITYEESVRQRVFALYDDPRLQPRFKEGIVHREDEMRLFIEVAHKEPDLSKALLADLAPFRARPSDPISIFNRPALKAAGLLQRGDSAQARSYLTAASAASPSPCEDEEFKKWKSRLVRGTNVRIWVKGSDAELNRFEPMVGMVWRTFPDYFDYPFPDNGKPDDCINPDPAIDIYFMSKGMFNPRVPQEALTVDGKTNPWGPTTDQTSSGYMMVDKDFPDDYVLNTIAHELTHVAQFQYDTQEVYAGPAWLMESTATYVGYKITKALGRLPTFEYDALDPHAPPLPSGKNRYPALFNRLHMSLNLERHQYSAWLFFESASIELGDEVVRNVWEQAAAKGIQAIRAVHSVIPLDDHFPRFAVRNWNRDLKPQQWPYNEHDRTFRKGLKPSQIVNVKMAGPGIDELNEPVVTLASRYYHYTFADGIRKVTFENLFVGVDYAHVWAIKSIGGKWKEPEDWTKDDKHEFCRDLDDENLTDLIIVISNSNLYTDPMQDTPLPSHPVPRMVADAVGCQLVAGWAQATLRVKEGDNDVSYVSNRVKLKFKPRASPLQNMPGDTQYDLMPTAVTWTASGKEGDCTIDGQIGISIPSFENQPLDNLVLQPAYGYMNVVGLDGGDFHSVKVSATNHNAFFKKTCPGDPPTVSKYFSGVAWLLLVLSEKNIYEGSTVAFKGTKTVDVAKGTAVLDLLPPGTVLPDFALQALSQAERSSRSEVYTWNWELRPLNFGQTSGN